MVQLSHPPAPIGGCFVVRELERKFLPLVDVDAHTVILSASSRTTLTQTFVNPDSKSRLDEVSYDFPLYDGVAVVGFTCTIGDRRVKGVVKERRAARQAYEDAASRGEAAGLLEQNVRASDVFRASIGNVPAGQKVLVEITYVGELEHDAEADAVRLTIPTSVAPRYDGSQLGTVAHSPALDVDQGGGRMSITVDAIMADDCSITKIHSPSHPISVTIGKTSKALSNSASPERASATLALGTSKLEKDFVMMIEADGLGTPTAILESHPELQRRALMTTLVPRFNLPVDKPEIVFVCDRSGSMGMGKKMPNLIAALQIFLKSLPVGVRFNVCSFGSSFSFLWETSQIYSQSSLDKAVRHVKSFKDDYGGTEIYRPMEETFRRRIPDKNLEVFLLTDGQIWDQNHLFDMINDYMVKNYSAIRIFTLGVGDEASSALIQGVARAGNGFAQKVGEDEKMDKKIIRMLKGALTPHIHDYTLEILYAQPVGTDDMAVDEDFEVVEKVECSTVSAEQVVAIRSKAAEPESQKKVISLFDPDVKDDDLEMTGVDAESIQIPDVAQPRYLQSPIKIPALFPFNRTTVYVMLSASTPPREITSVVLKGTSPQGPLRLEVPVTKLAEKGTTIQQLAAHKAMQELEENGGWIAQATDDSGKLLRKELEGQFDKMTEREGVRLGVEYQVSGKWCSFVAVEEGTADGKDTPSLGEFGVIRAEDMEPPRVVAQSRVAQTFMPTLVGSSLMCLNAAAPAQGTSTSFGGDARCLDTASPAPGMWQGGGMERRGPMRGGMGGRGGAAPFGWAPASVPAAPCGSTNVSTTQGFQASSKRKTSRLMGGGRENSSEESGNEGVEGESGIDDDDPLAGLASLQTFIGSWTWSHKLETILGVTQRAMEETPLYVESVTKADILATLCAVLFLKTRLADQKDTWEMMVEKAEGWVEEQTGETAAKLEQMVKDAGHFRLA